MTISAKRIAILPGQRIAELVATLERAGMEVVLAEQISVQTIKPIAPISICLAAQQGKQRAQWKTETRGRKSR